MKRKRKSERQRFTLALGSSGRLRVPSWVEGCALAVRWDDREVEFSLAPSPHPCRPGQTLSLCGPWMRDIFPRESLGREGRATARSRAMMLLFGREGDRWVARVPRDLSWYGEFRTRASRSKDDDTRG